MRRAATLLLLVLLALAGPAPAAEAHTVLQSSSPRDGAVLDRLPDRVELRFGEPVEVRSVRVLSAAGADLAGRPVARGDAVDVPLPAVPGEGSYVVAWRVTSGEGHPLAGALTFSVGSPSAPAAVLLARDDVTAVTAASGLPAGGLLVTRVLGLGALVVLLGAAVFCLLLWREGLVRLAPLLRAAAAVEAATAVLALLLLGPYATGRGLGAALDLPPLSTGYGGATAARAVLASLALLLVRTRLVALLALACAVTWSVAGHARVGPWQPLALVADVTHLLAVSVWLGGLVVLVLGLRGRWSDAECARVLPRWSRLAAAAVALLVVTGALAAVREVGDVDALLGTSYGRLVVTKACLVAVVLLLGALGRAAARDGGDLRLLRRSAAVEVAVAAAVVAVAALLAGTTPGRSVPPDAGASAVR